MNNRDNKREAHDLAKLISDFAYEKKAEQVVMMDMEKVAGFTDYFVIISGSSDMQIKAIVDNIEERLTDRGIKAHHREGYENLSWVLLDFSDVVVHVFNREARQYYGLETLWSDAPREEVQDSLE